MIELVDKHTNELIRIFANENEYKEWLKQANLNDFWKWLIIVNA